jgi:selenocysteine-specific elongation factor
MLFEREPCDAAELHPAETGLEPDVRDTALSALEASGRARSLGGLWFTDEGWTRVTERAQAELRRYHSRMPLRPGIPPEELRERLSLEGAAFAAVVAAGVEDGWLVREDGALRLPTHAVAFAPDIEQRSAGLMRQFRDKPYTPPSTKGAEAAVGGDVVAALVQRGDLVQASPDVLFSREAFDEMQRGVLSHIDANGQVAVADVRDRYDTSRKYALALLEYLDRQRVTRRVGDARVRGPAAQRDASGDATSTDAGDPGSST